MLPRSFAGRQPLSPKRPWKVGIVGFGAYAESGHAPAYHDSEAFRLMAVADPVTGRRQVAEQTAGVAACESIEELLRADIDLVDICSPPSLHFEQALAALQAGKHVLCEKPVVARIDQLQQLLGLAESRSLRLVAGHNYRFSPAIRRFVELGDSVGKDARLFIDVQRTGAALGTPEWSPHWRRAEGGVLMDHGPHAISVACWLAGEAPLEIAAMVCTDSARIELEFREVQAQINLSWTACRRHTEHRLQGSLGELTLRDYSLLELRRDGQAPLMETFLLERPQLWTQSMIAAYGRTWNSDDEELRWVTEALELARASSLVAGGSFVL